MPIYKLKCTECDFIYENYKCLVEDRNKVKCPKCGKLMKTVPVFCNAYVLDERFNGIKD